MIAFLLSLGLGWLLTLAARGALATPRPSWADDPDSNIRSITRLY